MATGDLTFFQEALDYAFFNSWAATDDIKCAVLDPTTAPAISSTTPALGDFTEIGTAGSYTAGGVSLGTWGGLASQSGTTLTFDSATNPSFTQHVDNDTDARWLLLYNDTQAGDPAFAFVDLGSNRDLSIGSLNITWNASGIFTISM